MELRQNIQLWLEESEVDKYNRYKFFMICSINEKYINVIYSTKFDATRAVNVNLVDKIYVFYTATSRALVTMAWQDFKRKHLNDVDLTKFENQILPICIKEKWILIIVHNVVSRMRGETSQPG